MPGIWQGLFHPVNNSPMHLLYALAVENTLKGIVVGKDNDLIQPKKLAKIIKDTRHNLREICELGKIELSCNELKLLDKLTETIKWSGRYPTPLHDEQLMPKDKSSGKRKPPGLDYWSTDFDDTRELYRKLESHLKTLLHDKFSVTPIGC